jgi:hypothetical protein
MGSMGQAYETKQKQKEIVLRSSLGVMQGLRMVALSS